MNERLKEYGFKERKVLPDGNCMMRAIADQLEGDFNGKNKRVKHQAMPSQYVRGKIVRWLMANPDYPLDNTPPPAGSKPTTIQDFLDRDQFPTWRDYCYYMSKDGTWGDHLALVAASEAFSKKIWILSSVDTQGSEPVTVIEPRLSKADKTIYLSHWHENHYNSLQKTKDDSSSTSSSSDSESDSDSSSSPPTPRSRL